jgi:hypothetical protein
MFNRFLAIALTTGTLAFPVSARADDVGRAVGAAVVGGLIVGGIVAATTIPDQHREPLYDHIRRENRPSYRYEEEVVVGRELRDGPYESYPVPERYGVPPGHHYTIINDRPVVYHRESRRVIHHY